jgi:hypothetical protein
MGKCPYVDDAVYTVTMASGKEYTGTFYDSVADSPFWTVETAESVHDWLAINPVLIVEVRPASGTAYAKHVQHFS